MTHTDPTYNLAPRPDDVVIIGGARTPQGKLNGQLAGLTAVQLGAAAVSGALEEAGIHPGLVDAVVIGQVVQAGSGQNPARQTALKAGIGGKVPATTINKVCLSGLTAVIDAARLIRAGDAEVVVAGGQESMSQSPHLLPGLRHGWLYGGGNLIDSLVPDGLTDALEDVSMGILTERGNQVHGIGRLQQDEVAAASHQRAAQAADEGVFKDEIVPITVERRKGESVILSKDEQVRPGTHIVTLGQLRPAFVADGSITAGNASPLSDGAAALVLTTRTNAERRQLEILAVVGAPGQVAGPGNSLHSQPSNAINAALTRAGWATYDLDFVGINEAFGAIVVQSLNELGIPLDLCNIHGGAIAVGHPIGASGARIALHAANELLRRGVGKAAVALCGGGGQGEALLLYRN
ncbi:acetyl-CoA C-acetyltransferase [Arthrobacter sp. ISL-30]|uniref:acetyl-CoA C-acetyltransferase n=1 Tax=Arthrobacter sp. ISL-30 TaxID=2819109 RepID=UPI001BE8EFC4|nr:acetyl-CoA C-acetyltransferase [Arthrobacter sp. ISL-30]MBT2515622.1 acetyl-CoA C-acetyltransferase [Arthrobacter sp. ISL-30]